MIEKLFSNPLYVKHREMMLCLLDLCIVFVSFLLAYWIRIDFRFPDFAQLDIVKCLIALLIVLIVYAISFFVFKIHKSLWKYIGPVETIRIGLSVLLASIVLFILVIATSISRSYTSVVVTGGLLTAILMYTVRVSYRLYRRSSMKVDGPRKKAVIIGAGDAGYILLKEIIQNDSFHVEVVGFVDDKRYNNMVSGYKVLGDTYDLPEIVSKYGIEEAFIAIPSADKTNLRRINDICQSCKLETKIMKRGDKIIESDLEKKYDAKKYPVQDISIEDLLGRGEIHLDQDEIQSYITGKVIVVTGAGGSIGSELCRQIVKFNPKELVMIDINENSLYMLEQEFNRNRVHGTLNPEIKILSLIASIREFTAISDIFKEKQPSVVFHAAAHKHVPLMETRPMEAIKNNVFGTNNVIKACIKNNVSRFIMISTDKAVNPTNVMGATKRMTEMIMQANGKNGVTKMAAVRFGNVLGSNGSVIPIFKQQTAEGGPVTITDKKIIRYFMTIPEAAQLVLQAGYYADKGEIFVLDMGEPVKILDLAEKMIRMSGFKPYEDIDIVEIGLRPGEKMYEELKLDGETRIRTKNDLIFKNNIMDITIDDINEKLNILSKKLQDNVSEAEYKETMLKVIKDKSID
ncbi:MULTISPECIES: polysaccharide biosynthesis protein [unclassified Amedibacterium]|uniref:polysaccharide biosynthesis protein n=1 Tax=unclassified Amedibacterium TaxID=3088137 RepID=UPI000E3F707C|nr:MULTISPECIES: nucleoside-diphosphate sugar epimerase/dehydratase [unclassified Absiella]RGB63065.1 polysaccharide biosynthesis protein [Absiella sp. AM09-45]RGB72215.1 polysaccharide biosynthesis protein [Absiella sp. AM09-50]